MNFEFNMLTPSPLELFDQERWVECLHAAMQAYNAAGDAAATQAAVEDTGILHELTHLAAGIPTWTHRSHAKLRELLEWTQVYVQKEFVP